MLSRGRIPDFRPVDELISKIDHFGRYSYIERQNIFATGKVRLYQPNEKIFSIGDRSPDLFILIYGAVNATVLRGEAGKFVTFVL